MTLTSQERAVFGTADNPMRNMTGMAEEMAARVEAETKAKIRRALDDPVGALLWELQQEYTTESHAEDHDRASDKWIAREGCMACRIERAVELLGMVTV